MGGQEKVFCYISESIKCRDIIGGCRSAVSWCDLDLTFDLAVVTLSLKILRGLYLTDHKV